MKTHTLFNNHIDVAVQENIECSENLRVSSDAVVVQLLHLLRRLV